MVRNGLRAHFAARVLAYGRNQGAGPPVAGPPQQVAGCFTNQATFGFRVWPRYDITAPKLNQVPAVT